MTCDKTYDEGYVFTMYFYYGSNYFHLHYDMMIPLFSELRNEDKGKKIVLMPSVESVRLQVCLRINLVSGEMTRAEHRNKIMLL